MKLLGWFGLSAIIWFCFVDILWLFVEEPFNQFAVINFLLSCIFLVLLFYYCFKVMSHSKWEGLKQGLGIGISLCFLIYSFVNLPIETSESYTNGQMTNAGYDSILEKILKTDYIRYDHSSFDAYLEGLFIFYPFMLPLLLGGPAIGYLYGKNKEDKIKRILYKKLQKWKEEGYKVDKLEKILK